MFKGIGYEIDVPMSTFYDLPATGVQATLYTHLLIREDVHLLFGFATESERQTFRQLIKIYGCGCKNCTGAFVGVECDLICIACCGRHRIVRTTHSSARYRKKNS
jgi:Holliday junction resolvasome RuvABC DNA-binding subunit